mmetsp:Transcript_46582/g.84190  ORF Transcript_46582/g.84190 Transcript_46582/m.84190 type:complete len:138 (+) Transcript_46582:2-415(+)
MANMPWKDELSVETETLFRTSRSDDDSVQPILRADWNMDIGAPADEDSWEILKSLGSDVAAMAAWQDVFGKCFPSMKWTLPLNVTGKSTFAFNEAGKAESMQIDSWSINGDELGFPPEEISDSNEASMSEWASKIFR